MFSNRPLDFALPHRRSLLRFRSLILLAITAIAAGSLCYLYKVGPFRPSLSREKYLAICEAIRTNAIIHHYFR